MDQISASRACAALRGGAQAEHVIDALQRGVECPDLLWHGLAALRADPDAVRAFCRRLQKQIESARAAL